MKRLASLTLSLLFLASLNLPAAHAQDNTDVPDASGAAVADDAAAESDFPALDDSDQTDMSLEEIINSAASSEESPETLPETPVAPEGAAPTPQEEAAAPTEDMPVVEEVETADPLADPAAQEQGVGVVEPSQEGLESTPADEPEMVEEEMPEIDPMQALSDLGKMDFKDDNILQTPKAAEVAPPVDNKITGLKSAGVPASVIVPEASSDYMDIHARRILYKSEAEKLTASLNNRRVSFEAAHFQALEKYRVDVEKMYETDSKSYLENFGKDPEKVAAEAKKSEEVTTTASTDTPEILPAPESEVGLKEKELPPVLDDAGNEVEKKKVVMPGDAPEFDPQFFE